MLGEKVVIDYTARKRAVPSNGIVRSPKCGKFSKMWESKLGINFDHKIYSTNRHEGCHIPNSKREEYGFPPNDKAK